MFANSLRIEAVIRALLIGVIFFNTLTSSTVFAQAKQGSISVTSPNIEGAERESSVFPAEQPGDITMGAVDRQQATNTKSQPSTMFIENVGQFDPKVEFLVQGSNANIYLAQNEIWFTVIEITKKENRTENILNKGIPQKEKVKAVNLKMVFPGSNPDTKIEPFDRIDVNISYFIGNDSKQQLTNVPAWGGVRYIELYPGADLELTSENGVFVWRIVVTDTIKFASSNNYVSSHGLSMKIAGQKQWRITNGKVDIDTELRNFILPALAIKGQVDERMFSTTPKVIGDQLFLIYPKTPSVNSETTAPGSFASLTLDQTNLSPSLQAQEPNLSRLVFARLLGLGADDEYSGAYAHAVGPDGSMYITGQTFSINFPTLSGYQEYLSGDADAFVVKLNPDGSLGYSTYFGGTGYDYAGAIAVNQNGEVYIAGYTTSYDDLPRTADALVTNSNGFLTKLSAGGNQLLYSSYVGSGSTRIWDLGIDAEENVYVLDNGYDSSRPAKVYKLEPGNSTYDYVYTWGPGTFGYGGMAVGGNGYVYLTSGSTGLDVSVTSLTDSGTVSYSISFGGTDIDWGNEIAVDQQGYAYVIGITYSADFPGEVIPEDICSSCRNTLVAIISPTGSLQYSARIEGIGGLEDAIAIDRQGQIYLIGSTSDLLLPVTADAVWAGNQGDSQDIGDVVVVRLTPSIIRGGYSITYLTAVGGTGYDWVGLSGAVDDSGNIYLSGETDSTDFIGTEGETFVQEKAFAAKISTYDCSGTTLLPIGQAVLEASPDVAEQNYCLNTFDKFTFIEDEATGQAAYEEFAELARQANYEVDFTTMIWDKRAGEIFLAGVKDLYEKVRANPGSEVVRVRILLGLEHYLGGDQRHSVLESLADMSVPLEPTDLPWKIEVASYRNSPRIAEYVRPNIHSHVKMLIVDGNYAIVNGYNVQNLYIDTPMKDVGLKISGPIVQDSIKVFDELWYEARGLRCKGIGCTYTTEPLGQIPHASEIYSLQPATSNPVNMFSLFRNHDTEKLADTAIADAIRASSTKINLLQNRFFENDTTIVKCIKNWCFNVYLPPSIPINDNGPFPYTQPIIDAAQNDVQIRMLLSGTEETISLLSIDNLRRKILSLPDGANIFSNIVVKFTKDPLHAKALSIDGQFVLVGSQNFDFSAFGDDPENINDLAEYSFGVDNEAVADEFDIKFDDLWNNARESARVDQSIQQTIDQAAPETIIYIPTGTYQESLIINKPLILVGADGNQTVIHPVGNQPAIRVTSSDVEVSNLRISGGESYGIELIDNSPSSLKNIQINRVVFENNAEGGVLAQGLIPGSPMNYTIENNTFIGGADGITVNMVETQTETSFIRNNIFSGQSTAPVHILSTDDSRIEYSYNLFDNCGGGLCAANWVQGNLSFLSSAHDNLFDADPLFNSPENGAYQLSAGSPAIDAGDPTLLQSLIQDGDNDGSTRIDIGAFEYAPDINVPPIVNAGDDQTVGLDNPVTLTATYNDANDSENHSARIDWGDGMLETATANIIGPGIGEVNGQHTYANPGNYTVEVCVADPYGGVGCDTMNVAVAPPTGSTEIKIGETFILPYDDYGNGDLMVAQHTTLSQEATLQSLSFYVTQAAGNLRLGIYDDANGNPGTLVAKTDEFIPVVGWNTQSVQTPVLLPPGSYWLAFLPESDDLHVLSGWPGLSQETGRYYGYPYGEMPLTFSSSAGSGEFQFSFYATFTVAAEPGTVYVGEVNVLHADAGESSNLLIAQQTQLTHTATVQSLSFYVTNTVGKLRLGIYDDGWDGPGALMAQTDEFTPVVGWNTVSVQTPTLLPAGTYWLAFLPESDDLWFKYEWVPGLYTGRIYGYPFGEMPSMVTDQPIGVEYRYSLYATFIEDDSVYTPSTSVLDDFNRVDGTIGISWSGETSEVGIASNQLTVNSFDTTIGWNNEPFGADQEAYVTFSQLNTSTYNDQGLALKMQSNGTLEDGAIVVSYDGGGEHFHVYTYDDTQGWAQHGNDIYVTFTNGDLLGVRARADGIVEVYRNSELVAVRNITSWPYYAQGGYIGLSFYGAEGAVVDDFGGGTLAGGEMMMASTFSTFEAGPQSEGSIEFSVMSSQFDPATDLDRALLQIASTVSGQTAYVMIAKESAGEIVLDRSHSHRTLKDGDLRVLFDMAGQRIQILKYDSQKGWAQVNKDISVRFNVGDRFRLFLRADGTLEIYRNGKLLAKRDVTP